MDEHFFFHWPLGDGAPRATTQYLNALGLDKYFRSYMAVRVSSWEIKAQMNNTCYWFRDLWVIPFFNQSIRFSLCSLVVFFTSLATLRGRLDCPSCAVGTSVQRSKEFHSGTGRDLRHIFMEVNPGIPGYPGIPLEPGWHRNVLAS